MRDCQVHRMSRPTGEVREAAKPDLRVEDPNGRDVMDSILLLAKQAVSQLGEQSEAAQEMRKTLQKLEQAAAKVSWQQQETPKPAAVAATPISSKSCEQVEKKEEASPAAAVASLSSTRCRMGCQMRHRIEECPSFCSSLPTCGISG